MHTKGLNIYTTLLLFFTFTSVICQTHITTSFKDYKLDTFNSKKISLLEIKGQHADINILNWDKDSISVETSVEILSDKENLSAELLKKINTSTIKTANTIRVQTKISDDFQSTIPYKITYNIFCPSKIHLRIKNSYGMVNAANFNAGIIADISYCSIKFQNMSNLNSTKKNQINLSFCKGEIKNVGSGKLDIKNSEVVFSNADSINCNSSYSKLSFMNTLSYTGISSIDKVSIGTVKNIHLEASNTIAKINLFTNSAFIDFTNGKLDIKNTSENFKKLTITGNQTPVSIVVNKKASYTINGEIKVGKLLHPNLKSISVIQDGITSSFTGEINNPETNTLSQIIIFNQKQNVEFK